MSRARRVMQRKVATTTIEYSTIAVENGTVVQSEPKTITAVGKLSEMKAHNEINKVEVEQFVILNIEHAEYLYSMDVEEFLKLAQKEEIKNQEDVK